MSKPRSHLVGLKPYPLPERSPHRDNELLQLDSNENFSGLHPEIVEAAKRACHEAPQYPEDYAAELCQAIARVHQLNPERIVCARGAMELISMLATIYLEPGLNAVVTQFGYLYFRAAIEFSGASAIIVPEQNLIADIDAMADQVNADTRLVFVANPANPAGSLLTNQQLLRLRLALPESVILVIDEAYAEYVDPAIYHPNFALVEQGNTVILRTFSKIYGIAGFRVGWGVFPRAIGDTVRVIQQPNAVTGVSQAAAIAAINQTELVPRTRDQTQQVRASFSADLSAMGLIAYPSHGNFVLVRFDSTGAAAAAALYLRERNILVKLLDAYGLSDCVRITIGRQSQMNRVIVCLREWIKL